MKADFRSAWLLINRAEAHLSEFKGLSGEYNESHPYTKFTEVDAKTRRQLFKAKITTPPPEMLSVIAYDIFQCLRSSLDHAVYDAARKIGGSPRPQSTKFPFGKHKADAEKDGKRKRSEVPFEIDCACLKFRPYRRGNRTLWAMNEMRNSKIHRTLSAMAFTVGGVSVNILSVAESLHIGEISTRRWDGQKNELTYMDIGQGEQMDSRQEINVLVAFANSTPFARRPAVEVFDECISLTREVVGSLEAETIRIIKSRP
jgi:hypothetical protein